MIKDLVFEIGTEEIPARFMPAALGQITKLAEQFLQEYRFSYQKLNSYGTPRRLALYVTGLASQQSELIKEVKGPPLKVAYSADGQPTKAAEGFARSQKVNVKDLKTRRYKGGEYVFAVKKEMGQPAEKILPDLLLNIAKGLNFPSPMRWGSGKVRFVRPIRWVMALYGQETVPLKLAGLTAGRETYGHRFIAPGPHTLTDAEKYFDLLEENYVLVDQNRRRKLIWEQMTSLAAQEGGRVEEDPDLLEEITYLLEYPTALIGHFDRDYLQLPAEVVVTPMRDHQRYFPVWNDKGELLPLFIGVNNGTGAYLDIISRGNEKVLAARLADAAFFYQEDQKTTLEDKAARLEEIVFREELGTMLAKTRRLQKLAATLGKKLDLPAKLIPAIKRTARLAKADLLTAMVNEFPELQGTMGSYYAAYDGEKEIVCQGIKQHYWPRHAGDQLPDSLTGMVVGLADRLDTLVGCFAAGLIPTGSQDPYALRRQATGLVNIAIELNLNFSLQEAIDAAYDGYNSEGIKLDQPLTVVRKELTQFCRQRAEYILADKGIRFDVIQAVLAAGDDDLSDVYHRARDLNAFRQEQGFSALQKAFTRAFNLTSRAAAEQFCLRPEIMQTEAETGLYRTLGKVRTGVLPLLRRGDYMEALKAMIALQEPIDLFFDGVMVMVPEKEVRENRLALLQEVVNLVLQIADFSQLVS